MIDRKTRRLVPQAPSILSGLSGEGFTAELHQTVLESNSRPHRELRSLQEDLVALRAELVAVAGKWDLGVAAVGTVPLADFGIAALTPDERYERIGHTYGALTREQLICGMHVHVEAEDRDLAVRALPWIAPWVPVLLALSASSPYWQGADTGYASWRTQMWQRWPAAGPVGSYGSAAEYDAMIAGLVDSGVLLDANMLYQDLRLSSHLPTIELRVCDSCPSPETPILVAGLFRALVTHGLRSAAEAGAVPPAAWPAEWRRAASWRAARSGLEGPLLDPLRFGTAPAADVVRRLVAYVRPYLEEFGDWPLVSALVERTLATGSAAENQRRAARGWAWEPARAVDWVLERTAAAPDWPTLPVPRQRTAAVAPDTLRDDGESAFADGVPPLPPLPPLPPAARVAHLGREAPGTPVARIPGVPGVPPVTQVPPVPPVPTEPSPL